LRPGTDGPVDLDLLVFALRRSVVLVELDMVEAVSAQAVVVDDEGRPVPAGVVEGDADRRLDLDRRVVVGSANVVGADLAGDRDVGSTIWRAYGTNVRGGHRRRQAPLLGAQDHDESADSQREDQTQAGSSQLLCPAPHPPESRPLSRKAASGGP